MTTDKEKFLESKVRDYFGSRDYELELTDCGGCIYVSIRYKDFMPRREVRRYIESLSEGVYADVVERSYSDETIRRAYARLSDAEDIVVKLPSGGEVVLDVYVCSMLEDEEL